MGLVSHAVHDGGRHVLGSVSLSSVIFYDFTLFGFGLYCCASFLVSPLFLLPLCSVGILIAAINSLFFTVTQQVVVVFLTLLDVEWYCLCFCQQRIVFLFLHDESSVYSFFHIRSLSLTTYQTSSMSTSLVIPDDIICLYSKRITFLVSSCEFHFSSQGYSEILDAEGGGFG